MEIRRVAKLKRTCYIFTLIVVNEERGIRSRNDHVTTSLEKGVNWVLDFLEYNRMYEGEDFDEVIFVNHPFWKEEKPKIAPMFPMEIGRARRGDYRWQFMLDRKEY